MSSMKPFSNGRREWGGATEPIAVVGMVCRLPAVGDLEAVGRLVRAGGRVTGARADREGSNADSSGPAPHLVTPPVAVQEGFDAAFFGISPSDAALLDPREGLALELTWHACEDAGILPEDLRGTDTAVFTAGDGTDGVLGADGTDGALAARIAGYYGLLVGHDGLPDGPLDGLHNRPLDGLLDPDTTPDAASCSSLVAVHRACDSLRRGDARFALAGGVLMLPAGDRAASADPVGVGGALLLLRPLAAALAAGDRIRGVVFGSAVTRRASGTLSIAEDRRAQCELVTAALTDARLDVADLGCAEVQGPLVADRGEVSGLATAMAGRREPLPIGSVSSIFPGLAGLSGVVGLVATLLGVEQGFLAPHPELAGSDPGADLRGAGLRVLSSAETWLPAARRCALVGAFGSGDVQCQLIIGQPPSVRGISSTQTPGPRGPATTTVPWLVSARSPASLRAQAASLAGELGTDDRPDAIREALRRHRTAHPVRAAVLSEDPGAALIALAAGDLHPDAVLGQAHQGRTALLFPTVDPRRLPSTIPLVSGSAAFTNQLRSCARALLAAGEGALADHAREAAGELGTDRISLGADSVGPVWWAVMVSLAALWREAGVEPVVVLGSGIGEIAAATVAGALSVQDGARIVIARCAADRAVGRIGRSAARDWLRSELRTVWPRRTSIGVVSTRTGREHQSTELTVDYWADSLLTADRVDDAVLAATRQYGLGRILECSTHPMLADRVSGVLSGVLSPVQADSQMDAQMDVQTSTGRRRTDPPGSGALDLPPVVLGTLDGGEGSVADVRRALALAWTSGADVAWTPASSVSSRLLPGLTGYPFERLFQRPPTRQLDPPSAPVVPLPTPAVGPQAAALIIWPLSAQTAAGLRERAGRLAATAAQGPGLLGSGPTGSGPMATEPMATEPTAAESFAHRAVVIARDRTELVAALRQLAVGADHHAAVRGVVDGVVHPVLVFPGTGAVWSGVTGGLVESSAPYWESLSRYDGMVAPLIDWSVLDVVRGEADAPAATDPVVAEVTSFAVAIALAALWRAVGVRPTAVLGRRAGELAAARDARIVDLAPALAALVGAARAATGTTIGRASQQRFGALRPKPGRCALHSSTLGREVAPPTITGQYFEHALHRSNRFTDAVLGIAASDLGVPLFIEVSADPTVVDTITGALAGAGLPGHVIGTLARGEPDVTSFARAIAVAWVRGVDIEWEQVHAVLTPSSADGRLS